MSRLFVIVRHGNTFAPGETPRRIGSATDLPLVESGRDQAQRLGMRFAARRWRFDRIVCSPLQRTWETAAIMQGLLPGAPLPEPLELLAEVDHGVDEDRPEDAVLARIGQDALTAWDRHGLAPPGWRVDRDARIAGWRRLYDAGGARTTLLVTSNGAARFALHADPVLAVQAEALPSLKLRTGAFGVIGQGRDGLRLIAWDRRL